ncbi:MAG TPA: hypothetical protein VGM77_10995 [Gemmatimonadales bacterium]|jgi:hypothetical protein
MRVTAVEGDEDHDATWLLGHTERIDFGPLYQDEGELWCQAAIEVPCRFLATNGDDPRQVRCTAWGYEAAVPLTRRVPEARQLGRDRFRIVDNKRLVTRRLDPPPPVAPTRRALPVVMTNPCAGAACRTSDNTQGDACCRDIHVDIKCSDRQPLLKALLSNRKSPYLCKPVDEEPGLLMVEIISACSFLADTGGCTLHGRHRDDGRPAKPLMCSAWPKKRTGLHPGCAFKSRKVPL